MYDSRVQEDGNDEAVPLIWSGIVCDVRRCDGGREYWVLGSSHAEAAEIVELTKSTVVGGSGAGPLDCAAFNAVLQSVDGVHARHVAGTHVDEDVGGGSDHWVKLGVDFDGGAGELCWGGSASPPSMIRIYIQFFTISTMNTTTWTVVRIYTSHGIRFPGCFSSPIPLKRFLRPCSSCDGAGAS